MNSGQRPLSDFALGVELRPFQAQALDALRVAEDGGATRLHVVAPPGAGKTILGLAWAIQRGRRAAIVAPTRTIAAQWERRFREHASSPITGRDEQLAIGGDTATGQLPDIVVLTYQAVSVKVRGSDQLHENVYAIFERLAVHGVRSLILDECHHLLDHWATAVGAWLQRVPDAVVLGLTATPPVDATARSQTRYLDLLGPATYQIPLPALVRSGHLAPYQDVCWLVRPTAAELRFLASAHERFREVQQRLDSPGEHVQSLAFWLLHRVEGEAEGRGKNSSWAEFLVSAPDQAIAFGRFLLARRTALPAEAWALDEMEDAPTLDDLALCIEDYFTHYLGPLAGVGPHPMGLVSVTPAERRAAEALRGEIRSALEPVGYQLGRSGVRRRASALDRLLGLSAAKYGGLEAILCHELSNLGADLRAVVVVDFERASSGKLVRELDGVLDPEAGGAVSVLRFIAAHEVLDDLDAVMLSGSNLICDGDVSDVVADALRVAAREHGWRITIEAEASGGLVRLAGAGPDWQSSRYTLLVTELFEDGVIRCIVGTRGLLGEGWDTRSANVLVDLTGAAAFVSTNQLRGRCLRIDPDRPEKVANLWDVVAIEPSLERGFADWDRFVRKHGHVFGVSDDGAIETGVGHVHPRFAHAPRNELAAMISSINADMRARASNRRATRLAWRVGERYANETVQSIELRGVPRVADVSLESKLPPGVAHMRVRDFARVQADAERLLVEAAGHGDNADSRAASLRSEAATRREAAEHEQESALLVATESYRRGRNAMIRAGAVSAGIATAVGVGASVAALSLTAVAAAVATVVFALGLGASQWRRSRRSAAAATAGALGALAAAREDAMALTAQADELEREGAAVRAAADESAETALAAARKRLFLPVRREDSAKLYAGVLLGGFQRWAETADEAYRATVHIGERADGTLHVELRGASAGFTEVYARAFRELTGPLGDHRYLLRCEATDLARAGAIVLGDRDPSWRELDRGDAEGGAAHLAVPEPLAGHRSGADAFKWAWERAAGPCEVLYTRRGRGAELRARYLRQRWWRARPLRRSIWR